MRTRQLTVEGDLEEFDVSGLTSRENLDLVRRISEAGFCLHDTWGYRDVSGRTEIYYGHRIGSNACTIRPDEHRDHVDESLFVLRSGLGELLQPYERPYADPAAYRRFVRDVDTTLERRTGNQAVSSAYGTPDGRFVYYTYADKAPNGKRILNSYVHVVEV